MNIHGLQSNMGPASYLSEAENNKKKNKTTSTGKKIQNKKPTTNPQKNSICPNLHMGIKCKYKQIKKIVLISLE